MTTPLAPGLCTGVCTGCRRVGRSRSAWCGKLSSLAPLVVAVVAACSLLLTAVLLGPLGGKLKRPATLLPVHQASVHGRIPDRFEPTGRHASASSFVFVQCNPHTCAEHASDRPLFWWQDLHSRGMVVVYVVSHFAKPETAVWPNFSKANVREAVALLAVEAPEERPPLAKEMALLKYARSHLLPHQLMVKSDADAVFHPGRLLSALRGLDAGSDHLFSGRQVTSCECSVVPGAVVGHGCTVTTGSHYCSGWLYATSVATLRRIPESAFAPVANGTTGTVCKSSDLTVGRIMNGAGIRECQPMLLPGTHTPRGGISWPKNLTSGRWIHGWSGLCNNVGLSGGVGNVKYVAWPAAFARSDYSECIGIHPAKARHDVRYLAHRMLEGKLAPDWPMAASVCTAAVGILSTPRDFSARSVARLTYQPLGRLLGMRFKFFVGEEPKGTPPLITAAIASERDVAAVEVRERPDNAWGKVQHMMRWALESSCHFFVKADAGVYIRPMQLLKEWEVMGTRSGELLLAGHLQHPVPGQHNVEDNPASPQYMAHLYPKPSFPTYPKGHLYAMSRALLERVQAQAVSSPAFPVEDAAVGIIIEEATAEGVGGTVRFESPTAFSGPKCDSRTVLPLSPDQRRWDALLGIHAQEQDGLFCKVAPSPPPKKRL